MEVDKEMDEWKAEDMGLKRGHKKTDWTKNKQKHIEETNMLGRNECRGQILMYRLKIHE